jgi:4-amino-4-deoxy-L-arabinose transferase-like glycosyltransferase
MLPYLYYLGKEVGNKRIGLFAVLFLGIASWPNIISRVGLRFELYPFFLAPTLYYLLHGLRVQRRNDFILAGLFLGLGLHGYTPFRIVPVVIVVAVGIYCSIKSKGKSGQAVTCLAVLALLLLLFSALLDISLKTSTVLLRALSRLDPSRDPCPIHGLKYYHEFWNALRMFKRDDGGI